jgi:hypothetical protein
MSQEEREGLRDVGGRPIGGDVTVVSHDHAIAAAFWGAVGGGCVLLVAYFVGLATPIIAIGWLLALTSVVTAFALAADESRKSGSGLVRSVGSGIRTALSWVFWFLP